MAKTELRKFAHNALLLAAWHVTLYVAMRRMNTNLVALAIVIAIVVLVIAVQLLRRPKKPRQSASRSQLDSMTLAQLRKAGSDLARPHDIEFFLYFRDHNSAVKAADKMDRLGYDASVQQQPERGNREWLCFATKQMIPTIPNIDRCRTQLQAIADEFRGVYDGWGTPVERTH